MARPTTPARIDPGSPWYEWPDPNTTEDAATAHHQVRRGVRAHTRNPRNRNSSQNPAVSDTGQNPASSRGVCGTIASTLASRGRSRARALALRRMAATLLALIVDITSTSATD